MYTPEEREAVAKLDGAHQQAIVALLVEKGIFTFDELRLKTLEKSGLTEAEFQNVLSLIGKG